MFSSSTFLCYIISSCLYYDNKHQLTSEKNMRCGDIIISIIATTPCCGERKHSNFVRLHITSYLQRMFLGYFCSSQHSSNRSGKNWSYFSRYTAQCLPTTCRRQLCAKIVLPEKVPLYF